MNIRSETRCLHCENHMGIETEEITDSWVPSHRDLEESDHKLKGGRILQTKFLILFYTLFLFYLSAFKKHTV